MNSKTQITLLISFLNGGGAQKVCVNVANGLVEIGLSVNLVVLNLKNSVYLNQLSKNVKITDLNVNHARFAIFPMLKYIFKNKPNLFIVFNYELTVLLVLIRLIFNIKFKILTRNINTL